MNKVFVIGAILVIVLVSGFILSQNKGDSVQEQKPATKESKASVIVEGYKGNVLAGKTSFYLDFNREDYDKALESGKIIFLDFYANWCPICRAEEPEIIEGFNSLMGDELIGFRVNFNDSDTDSSEKQLAKDFNVPYQHTKIFLKKGQEVARSVLQWDKGQFIKEVNLIIKN